MAEQSSAYHQNNTRYTLDLEHLETMGSVQDYTDGSADAAGRNGGERKNIL